MRTSVIAWLIFSAAAALEVTGDAVIRQGLRGSGLALIAAGCVMLGCYGVVVNLVPWDFSRLLGVYVAVFAAVSVLCGRLVFGESVPASTWVGLVIIMTGGLVIQFGTVVKQEAVQASQTSGRRQTCAPHCPRSWATRAD